jgi:3-dehydroquinate dehydratase-2
MPKILVLHGPDLNLLGQRETEHYGTDTLESIDRSLVDRGRREGVRVETFQDHA